MTPNPVTQFLINKKWLVVFLTLSGITVLLFGRDLFRHVNNGGGGIIPGEKTDKEGNDTIMLASVGDIMCHSTQFNAAKKGNTYDFTHVFQSVAPYLSTADLAFGNLETVTAGAEENYTGYPQFNTPAAILDGMKAAGFDVITTVNNHSLDRRFKGIERTIDSIRSRNFLHTGTYKEAADTNNVLIAESKGFRIAVLGYTFSTNGIPLPTGKEFCVSMIDSGRMQRDVQRARQAGADLITVFIHWGNEYERFPSKYQKNYANYMADLGVNVIFGSHPHVLQPAEVIEKGRKKCFVIYSMGNFVSGQRKAFTDYGTIVRVQFIRNKATGEITRGRTEFIPTYVSTAKNYAILPVADAIQAHGQNDKENFLNSPADINRLKQILPEATQHLTNTTIGFLPFSLNGKE